VAISVVWSENPEKELNFKFFLLRLALAFYLLVIDLHFSTPHHLITPAQITFQSPLFPSAIHLSALLSHSL
jgi:hypothetical protein